MNNEKLENQLNLALEATGGKEKSRKNWKSDMRKVPIHGS